MVVLGVGPLGMCFLMKARMSGARHHHRRGPLRLPVELRKAARRRLCHQRREYQSRRKVAGEIIRDLTHGRGADMVIECAGVPQAIPEALEMLRLGGLLVEAGNFSDLGEIGINPHRHLCSKSVRILVGGEEPASYGPSMRRMADRETVPTTRVRHRPLVGDRLRPLCRPSPDSDEVVIEPSARRRRPRPMASRWERSRDAGPENFSGAVTELSQSSSVAVCRAGRCAFPVLTIGTRRAHRSGKPAGWPKGAAIHRRIQPCMDAEQCNAGGAGAVGVRRRWVVHPSCLEAATF